MKSSAIAATPPSLLDAGRPTLEHLREAWRCAREETASAYQAWSKAPVAQPRTGYTVYLAAADREAAAESAFLRIVRAA
jgi:hypothetical protein